MFKKIVAGMFLSIVIHLIVKVSNESLTKYYLAREEELNKNLESYVGALNLASAHIQLQAEVIRSVCTDSVTVAFCRTVSEIESIARAQKRPHDMPSFYPYPDSKFLDSPRKHGVTTTTTDSAKKLQ